jgi:hypothetical protein
MLGSGLEVGTCLSLAKACTPNTHGTPVYRTVWFPALCDKPWTDRFPTMVLSVVPSSLRGTTSDIGSAVLCPWKGCSTTARNPASMKQETTGMVALG